MVKSEYLTKQHPLMIDIKAHYTISEVALLLTCSIKHWEWTTVKDNSKHYFDM